MKKDAGFLVLVGLISVILLIGASLLFFEPDITGNALFNVKSSLSSKITNTQKTVSCVDSDKGMDFENAGKVTIVTPSTSTTRIKATSKTQTLEDKCLDTKTLQEYYCKNGKSASTTKTCEDYCESGACKKYLVTESTSIDDAVKLVQKKTVQITTKDDKTNKWTIVNSYDSYSLPGSSFRIVCQQPCPIIPENLLMKRTVGAYLAINKLLRLTKLDIPNEAKPVDIHLTVDSQCISSNYAGYSGAIKQDLMGPYGKGSYMCLFEWEELKGFEKSMKETEAEYGPFDSTPMAPGLSDTKVGKISPQVLLLHEYTHLILNRVFIPSPEMFPISLSWKIVNWSNWPHLDCLYEKGCSIRYENILEITSPCQSYYSPSDYEKENALYGLCDNCNLNFEQMGKIFIEIGKQYQKNKLTNTAMEKKGGCKTWVMPSQFKPIIDNLIGKDSVNDCKVKWLGEYNPAVEKGSCAEAEKSML